MSLKSVFEAAVKQPALEALAKAKVFSDNPLPPTPDEDEAFHNRMARFAETEELRRQLEDAIKACKAEAAQLSEGLIEDMDANGIENFKIKGLTIFQKTNRYVSKKSDFSQGDICEELKKAGHENLCSMGYNAASLKSLVLEKMDNGEELPETLKDKLNIGEQTVLTSRRS